LLISSHCGFGRELSCYYSTSGLTFWPAFSYCQVTSVDLSDSFKAQDHSFTGSSAEKLAATTVHFYSSPNVDFIPKEILSEFPHLNGIEIYNCKTFTTVKNRFFSKDFDVLQYVWLPGNKIQTIEPQAFQYLVKLKWISLSNNQIESLPFQIFKNNPELIYIDLRYNKINSIDSDIFKNLNKLKFVQLTGTNLCIAKDFGCSSSTCSVSQAVLDSGLATCFSNCLNNMECSLKSGKFGKLSSDYIKENIKAIVSYGHLDVLIKQNYTDLLVKKGYLNLMVENGFLDLLVAQNYLDPLIQNGHLVLLIEKNYTDILIEKGYKNRIIESDWRLKLAYKDLEKVKTESNVQKISQNSDKIQTVENKFEEISATLGKVGLLEKGIADLKETVKSSGQQVTGNYGQAQIESTVSIALSSHLEKTKEEVKELNKVLSLQVSEAKLLMETEKLQSKLEKQAMEFEMRMLKQELADLKRESERRDADIKALKDQFNRFEISMRP
jgi:hypothetical protein